MTRDEFRAGMRRLAILFGFLVIAAIVVSGGFILFGANMRSGTSAGFGVVGVLLVFGGAAASTRGQSLRRVGDRIVVQDREERRSSTLLSGGLLALGVVFCAASLEIV